MKMLRTIMTVGLFFGVLHVIYPTEQATFETDSIQVKYRLNPIVKTATKIAHAQRDIAASISYVNSQTIEQAPTSATLELLQYQVPGLYVTEWGVMGFGVAGQSAGKISIRGAGGGANTHVLILRNGRPDFMGLMGCTVADEFSTDGVDHIEIIRGPGSFLYGTNATGGIINIIPKKMTREGFATQLGGGYGDFNTQNLIFDHGGKIGRFDYFFTANNRKTDGHREGSDYDGSHYTCHAGYRIGNKTTIDCNINMADLLVHDPGQTTNPKTNDWYDILRYGGDLNLIHQSKLGESNLKLHGNFGKHKFFDGWRSTDRTLGIMFYHNAKPWHGNTVTFGFDYKRYGGEAEDATQDYGKIFITEYAPYIYTQQLLLKKLIVSAGLRIENHELFGNEILPKAGLVFHASQSTSMRFSAGKGFRSPSIRELYFWMPANENLTPDRIDNYEIGFSQNIGTNFDFDIAFFRSEGSNLIQFSAPPPQWINSGKYTHNGYEITVSWSVLRNLYIGGSWSDMDLSQDVYNIPGGKLTAYFHYTIWRLTLSGNVLMVRDLTGADFTNSSAVPDLYPMDDYTVLNLSLKAKLIDNVSIGLTLKNALNEKYQAMYGYPMPGRYLIADMQYSL